MKSRSTPRSCAGHIDSPFILLLAVTISLCLLFGVLGSLDDYFDDLDCKEISDSVKYLSITREDDFVVDALKLHAFSKTEQPMSFWFKRIVEESNLAEGEDYVVVDNNGREQTLLTIDVVRGIAARTIENKGGFFQKPETRNARRTLECLQNPYFPKSEETAQ